MYGIVTTHRLRKSRKQTQRNGFWGRHTAEAKLERAVAKCARVKSAAGIRASRSARRVRSAHVARRSDATGGDSEGEPAPACLPQGKVRLSGYAAPKAGGAK
jgi:hypothetical protein